MTDTAIYEPAASALTTDRLRSVASNERRFLRDRGRSAAGSLTERHIVGFIPHREMIMLNGEAPDWVRQLAADINRVARLPHGWDSYGAERLKEKAVQHALEMLVAMNFSGPAPQAAPTPDGDLRLEWARGGDEFVLTVTADGEVSAYVDVDDEIAEYEASIADHRLGAMLRHFIG